MPAELDAALEPVRGALLDRARADATAAGAAADARAEGVLAGARAEADRLVAQARAQGAADGAAALAATRARARRQARSVVLAAQRAAYEELRRRARADALRLSGGAQRTSPVEGGGRRIVWSSDALADEALDALGGELEKLWAP
jgi:hypothetical protein